MRYEDTAIVFTVPFVKGQGRPRFTGRPYPHPYKAEADRAAEKAIEEAAKERIGQSATLPYYGRLPVGVQITCYEPLPKKTPRSISMQPFTKKPDVDNIAKLVLDALNGVMWTDDAQVVALSVIKEKRTRLFNEPQTSVRVYPVR